MKIKNIIINISSVLIISAALPAVAHQEATTGIHHKENVETPTAHEHATSSTDTHYMMHGGKGEQGHLMEGTKHAANQATEHQTQLITSSLTNSTQSKHYMMNSGDGPQGYLMEGKDHPKR